jgi:hypothetical protein
MSDGTSRLPGRSDRESDRRVSHERGHQWLPARAAGHIKRTIARSWGVFSMRRKTELATEALAGPWAHTSTWQSLCLWEHPIYIDVATTEAGSKPV